MTTRQQRIIPRAIAEQIFTASGSWQPPYLPIEIEVLCVGGGGGGESGSSNPTAASGGGGDGGGGGAVILAERLYLDETTGLITVTIGAGGTGGASTITTVKNVGTRGGSTTFGSLVTAYGGLGGGVPGTVVASQTGAYLPWGGNVADAHTGAGNGLGAGGGSEGRDPTSSGIPDTHSAGVGTSLTLVPSSADQKMFGGRSGAVSQSVNQIPGRGTRGYGGGGAGGAGGTNDVAGNRVPSDGGGAAGGVGANGSNATANTGGGGGGGGRCSVANGASGIGGNGASGLVIVRWPQRVRT